MLRYSTKIPADMVAAFLTVPFFFGLIVAGLGIVILWRVRKGYNKLKQREGKGYNELNQREGNVHESAMNQNAPSSSLAVRTVRGLAYRAEASRAGQSISKAKSSAQRSLENFAAKAEIDREVRKAVRDEFRRNDRKD